MIFTQDNSKDKKKTRQRATEDGNGGFEKLEFRVTQTASFLKDLTRQVVQLQDGQSSLESGQHKIMLALDKLLQNQKN